MENALIASGYRIQKVAPTTAGKDVVMSSVTYNANSESAHSYTFVLAINRIAMKRSYRLRDNYVEPISSLYVRGADPTTIALNDRIFLRTDAALRR